jgi:hypothetical protein
MPSRCQMEALHAAELPYTARRFALLHYFGIRTQCTAVGSEDRPMPGSAQHKSHTSQLLSFAGGSTRCTSNSLLLRRHTWKEFV